MEWFVNNKHSSQCHDVFSIVSLIFSISLWYKKNNMAKKKIIEFTNWFTKKLLKILSTWLNINLAEWK